MWVPYVRQSYMIRTLAKNVVVQLASLRDVMHIDARKVSRRETSERKAQRDAERARRRASERSSEA